MSCSQVQMTSPSLFPSPDPYRRRRCAKLYNIYIYICVCVLNMYVLYIYVCVKCMCYIYNMYTVYYAVYIYICYIYICVCYIYLYYELHFGCYKPRTNDQQTTLFVNSVSSGRWSRNPGNDFVVHGRAPAMSEEDEPVNEIASADRGEKKTAEISRVASGNS